MKKLVLLLFVTLFVSTSFAQDVAEWRSKIEMMNKEFTEAMINNDVDKLMSFYAEDILSLPSYQPMVRGMESIKKLSEEQMNSGWKTTAFSLSITDVMEAGDFVIEVGNYDMKMTGPGVPEWADNGKYLTVWEKQSDGSIKMRVETWNTDNNPWQEMQEMMQQEKPQME